MTLEYQPGDTILTVRVTGAYGFVPKIKVSSSHYMRTQTGANLVFTLPGGGTYDVYGYPGSNGTTDYVAEAQRVSMVDGERKTVTVEYEPAPGTISISLSHYMPDNVYEYLRDYTAIIYDIYGENGSHTSVRGYRNYPVEVKVPPGHYRVTSSTTATYNGVTYRANTVRTTVVSGETSEVEILFAAGFGRLRVWNLGSRPGYPAVVFEGMGLTYTAPAGSNPADFFDVPAGSYNARYPNPYYIDSHHRFLPNNRPHRITINDNATVGYRVYWQYQELVCTYYSGSYCRAWEWVDR